MERSGGGGGRMSGLEVHRQHPGARRKRTPSMETEVEQLALGLQTCQGASRSGLSHQARPGWAQEIPGGQAGPPKLLPPHLLNHSLISMWGHQGDKDQATLFSGLEAIGGAGIWIFLGRPRSLTFRPAPRAASSGWSPDLLFS